MKTKKIIAIICAAAISAAAFIPAFADEKPGAPVAVNADYNTFAGVKLCGTLCVANQGDGEFTFEITKQPKKGTVSLDGASFEYFPMKNKSGKDKFCFTATDKDGNVSKPATVTVNIRKGSDKQTFYYSDMLKSPAHYAALCLREEGIMSGETFGHDSFFYPEKPVSRAQFVALCACIAEMPMPSALIGTGLSDDEGIEAWARPYIVAAVDCGFVVGENTEDGNRVFRADDPITRAEAAEIINRALCLANDGRTMSLSDWESVPSWAEQAVKNTVASEVLPVFSDKTVRAKQTVTREDAALMLCAMLEKQQAQRSSASFFTRLWK